MNEPPSADWIRARVVARAAELGLTANAIAVRTGGAVSPDQVRAYLLGRKSMGSYRLQHVLQVLRLDVRPRARAPVAGTGEAPA